MKIKNVVRNSVGGFDCEIKHAVYGWIPFTASHDDVDIFGREIYLRIDGGEFGVIADYEPPIVLDDINE